LNIHFNIWYLSLTILINRFIICLLITELSEEWYFEMILMSVRFPADMMNHDMISNR
jgi:hypothetical protein